MSLVRPEPLLPGALLLRMSPATLRAAGEAESSSVAQLTRRLAGGDEAAFREFHARYFDRLVLFLLVVSRGDEHAAEEALQETFLRVVRYVRVFEREDVFWDWLKVVARSAARDAGRKHRRYRALLERFTFFSASGAEPPTPFPDDSALRAALDEALTSLQADDRALVEGRYLHGHTVAELAARGGSSVKSIESRLLRLRRRLADSILRRLRTP